MNILLFGSVGDTDTFPGNPKINNEIAQIIKRLAATKICEK